VRNSTTFLGRSLGPVLFATLAVSTGYRTLLLAAGVVALATGIATALVGRGVDSRAPPDGRPTEA
jgi:hypothetical protein